MQTKFEISKNVLARADTRMQNESVKQLWTAFTFGTSQILPETGDACRFVIGTPKLPTLAENAEYAFLVDENGAAIVGRDYPGLVRGYSALLQKIEYEPETGKLFLASTEEQSAFRLARRMIHFCIFPETDLGQLRRYLRFCAVLGFTHAVLEFWGMLKYDCLAELAWEQAYTKEQVAKLLTEMREMGLEPIPMFNHLGHASACRGASGKHVALDRNPSLYSLFTPDGWSWNLYNPKTRELLRAVRAELYELYGEGEFFHAGLDESYMISSNREMFAQLPAHLHDLTYSIAAEGKRPMIWMDMFLPAEAYGDLHKHACANKSAEQCGEILAALHPSTVLIDWHYHADKAPVCTTTYYKDSGFDVMGAPWLSQSNGLAHIDTAAENGLFGTMQTTWHTLAPDFPGIYLFAQNFGATKAPWASSSDLPSTCATLLRKVAFEKLSYEQSGWWENQIFLTPNDKSTYKN